MIGHNSKGKDNDMGEAEWKGQDLTTDQQDAANSCSPIDLSSRKKKNVQNSIQMPSEIDIFMNIEQKKIENKELADDKSVQKDISLPPNTEKNGRKSRSSEGEVVLPPSKRRQGTLEAMSACTAEAGTLGEPFSASQLEQHDNNASHLKASHLVGKVSSIKGEKARSSDDIITPKSLKKLYGSDLGTQSMKTTAGGSGLTVADYSDAAVFMKKSETGKVGKTIESTVVKLSNSAYKSRMQSDAKPTMKDLMNNNKLGVRVEVESFGASKVQAESSTNNVRAA